MFRENRIPLCVFNGMRFSSLCIYVCVCACLYVYAVRTKDFINSLIFDNNPRVKLKKRRPQGEVLMYSFYQILKSRVYRILS